MVVVLASAPSHLGPPNQGKSLCSLSNGSKLNRLHGNVETMAVLSIGGGDVSRKRDSIILTFADAKISVLEYDDSIHGLRTR